MLDERFWPWSAAAATVILHVAVLTVLPPLREISRPAETVVVRLQPIAPVALQSETPAPMPPPPPLPAALPVTAGAPRTAAAPAPVAARPQAQSHPVATTPVG